MCGHILQMQKEETGGGESLKMRVLVTPRAAAASAAAHQPSEEQLLHQQALTVAEYLMLHLFKAPLHFRSNLHHLGGREGGREESRRKGNQRPLLSAVRDARKREETTH